MNTTKKEWAALKAIVITVKTYCSNLNPVGAQVYSVVIWDYANKDLFPGRRSLSGIISSLAKKGMVRCWNETCYGHTENIHQ